MEAQFLSLEGDFVVRQGTELIEYHRISDIPDKFDHLIKFGKERGFSKRVDNSV